MGRRRGLLVGKGLTPRAGVARAMAPGGVGKNQQGFSLLELLISLAIAGIVTAALYNLFLSNQKVLGIQDQDAEMHQAARAAMDFMVRDFRMMGHGVPNSTWDPCPALLAPCPVAPPAKIFPNPYTPNATSITFRGNLNATRTTLQNDHASGSTTLTVVDNPTVDNPYRKFEVGNTIYVEGQTFATLPPATPPPPPYPTHWHTAKVTGITATT